LSNSRNLVMIIVLSIVLTCTLPVHVYHSEALASNGNPVHNLDTGLNYTSIQEAIDASETLDGHKIFVEKGVYYENVIVNKKISLIGENKDETFVDGEGTGSVICTIADNVTITGFTIQNSGRTISGTVPDAGISISHVSNCNVFGNSLIDNYVGIFVRPSRNAWFVNNIITRNHIGIDINNQSTLNIVSGNSLKENNVSIHVYYADFNVFFENNLTDSPVGVIVRYSSNNTFSENEIRNGLNGMILNGADFNGISKNIVLDLEYGIQVKVYADHNVISENSIKNCSYAGIDLEEHACDNSLSKNTIASSEVGIDISDCSVNNTISRNHLTANLVGMHFWNANLNEIFENNITNNSAGAVILYSQSNRFYHNTLLNNTQQVNISSDHTNCLDNDHPSGGNYWSDYTDIDLYGGPYQDEAGSDGIGDKSYFINENNTDRYPLMGPFHSFNTTMGKHVNIIANSTIGSFQYFETNSTIKMYVCNMTATQTFGFCRLTIPHDVLSPPYTVMINYGITNYTTVFENETLSIIYFSYSHSELEIVIVPDFPSFLILPLFMITTLLAVIIYRRKYSM
jgi:parallel beta-helix repeat protein